MVNDGVDQLSTTEQPQDADEDFDFEEPGLEPVERPPSYLDCRSFLTFTFAEYMLQFSYGMASEEQKKAVFPKRRPPGEPITYPNFKNRPCFELWVGGELTGLCDVHLSAYTSDRAEQAIRTLRATASLTAIYLKARRRKKGLLDEFLQVVAQAVFQDLMAWIFPLSRSGTQAFEVTIDAELESFGGQASVRLLGAYVEDALMRACEVTGLNIKTEIIDDAW